jgi:hypothetical protein
MFFPIVALENMLENPFGSSGNTHLVRREHQNPKKSLLL